MLWVNCVFLLGKEGSLEDIPHSSSILRVVLGLVGVLQRSFKKVEVPAPAQDNSGRTLTQSISCRSLQWYYIISETHSWPLELRFFHVVACIVVGWIIYNRSTRYRTTTQYPHYAYPNENSHNKKKQTNQTSTIIFNCFSYQSDPTEQKSSRTMNNQSTNLTSTHQLPVPPPAEPHACMHQPSSPHLLKLN